MKFHDQPPLEIIFDQSYFSTDARDLFFSSHAGKLYPEGLSKLSDCSDYDEVVRVAEFYAVRLPCAHSCVMLCCESAPAVLYFL